MKRFELVEFNAELLQRLQENGVKLTDYRYVGMVKDFQELVNNGHKRTYAAVVVAEKYGVSTRKAYDLLQRLCGDCGKGADG